MILAASAIVAELLGKRAWFVFAWLSAVGSSLIFYREIRWLESWTHLRRYNSLPLAVVWRLFLPVVVALAIGVTWPVIQAKDLEQQQLGLLSGARTPSLLVTPEAVNPANVFPIVFRVAAIESVSDLTVRCRLTSVETAETRFSEMTLGDEMKIGILDTNEARLFRCSPVTTRMAMAELESAEVALLAEFSLGVEPSRWSESRTFRLINDTKGKRWIATGTPVKTVQKEVGLR